MTKTKYISTIEAAQKWNLSRGRVHALAKQGRIKGAIQPWEGAPWRIPADAECPSRRTGRPAVSEYDDSPE